MLKKAAVVIGVDRTGDLTPLTSAAAGAQRIAKWLEGEGFKVECLTDKDGNPVTIEAVEKAVESFVTRPASNHLLLVYFSGHGYWQARSDVWLLSGAPTKTREAINLGRAASAAVYSGIPNVIFVSDACRSLPNSRSGAMVDGSGLFPNYEEIVDTSKIDYFKATSEALPAYEGKIFGEQQSVLTFALMSAYREPDPDMVLEIDEGSEKFEVVPNRRLETFLQRKVDSILFDIDPKLTQRIEVNVPSQDGVYLARVVRPALRGQPASQGPKPPPPIRDPAADAAAAITRSLMAPPPGGIGTPFDMKLEVKSKTEKQIQDRLPDKSVDHFETEMGLVVHGAAVTHAVASKPRPILAELVVPGDGQSAPGIIRLHSQRATSVAVTFADGRCVVLAALPGYIGHVRYDAQGVSDVSYVPSSNNWRWGEYNQKRGELDRMRAMVSLAVDHNTFRVSSNQEANALADRIRYSKGVDPSLGLYAGCAFSQAGNDKELVSVIEYMRDDLNADLFDLRLLAGRHPIARGSQYPVVPFCPMLTQSWNLLPTKRTGAHPTLHTASAYLCGSLWATFEPEGAKIINEAIDSGVFA